jgi:MraZ protein
VLFTGEYEHTIDAKLRLAIPAEIRAQLQRDAGKGEVSAVYAAPGINGGIWLWPERTFMEMANGIERSLLPAEELLEFDEITFPASRRLEIDGNGRIRLPERMLHQAALRSAVVILGMRDHLELRDPEHWNRLQEARHAKRREIVLRARQAQQAGSLPGSIPGALTGRHPASGSTAGGKEEGP